MFLLGAGAWVLRHLTPWCRRVRGSACGSCEQVVVVPCASACCSFARCWTPPRESSRVSPSRHRSSPPRSTNHKNVQIQTQTCRKNEKVEMRQTSASLFGAAWPKAALTLCRTFSSTSFPLEMSSSLSADEMPLSSLSDLKHKRARLAIHTDAVRDIRTWSVTHSVSSSSIASSLSSSSSASTSSSSSSSSATPSTPSSSALAFSD